MMLIITLILIVGMIHSPCIPYVSISKPSKVFDNGVNLHWMCVGWVEVKCDENQTWKCWVNFESLHTFDFNSFSNQWSLKSTWQGYGLGHDWMFKIETAHRGSRKTKIIEHFGIAVFELPFSIDIGFNISPQAFKAPLDGVISDNTKIIM